MTKAIGAALAAIAGITIVVAAVAKLALAQPTVLTPFGTATTVTTGAVVQIVAPNPSRKALMICAGGASSAFVAPQPSNPTINVGVPVAANSCFTPPPNLEASGSGTVGGAGWNGIANSATVGVVVLEW